MYSRHWLLPGLLVFPLSLIAQDSTTSAAVTPFRRGQWAAQFQAGSSGASLGFVKFRSPTRALVLDLRLGGAHSENSVTDSTGTPRFTGLSSDAFTQLRFGLRRYQPGTQRVVSHYTFGLLAGFDHDVGAGLGGSSKRNGWTAGLFGDVGGTYLVTPHLGLGALASASLSYTKSVTESQPSNFKGRTWQISGSGINATLVATLFF